MRQARGFAMMLRGQGLFQPHFALCALLNFSISKHSYAPNKKKAENRPLELQKEIPGNRR
jgi:hypothetical protein